MDSVRKKNIDNFVISCSRLREQFTVYYTVFQINVILYRDVAQRFNLSKQHFFNLVDFFWGDISMEKFVEKDFAAIEKFSMHLSSLDYMLRSISVDSFCEPETRRAANESLSILNLLNTKDDPDQEYRFDMKNDGIYCNSKKIGDFVFDITDLYKTTIGPRISVTVKYLTDGFVQRLFFVPPDLFRTASKFKKMIIGFCDFNISKKAYPSFYRWILELIRKPSIRVHEGNGIAKSMVLEMMRYNKRNNIFNVYYHYKMIKQDEIAISFFRMFEDYRRIVSGGINIREYQNLTMEVISPEYPSRYVKLASKRNGLVELGYSLECLIVNPFTLKEQKNPELLPGYIAS
jgi:hypothetical protein